MTNRYSKAVIEAAMLLNAIEVAVSRDKSIRLPHSSALHVWSLRQQLAVRLEVYE